MNMSKQNEFNEPGPALWNALGWEPSPTQLQQLIMLQQQLREWNKRVNLTRLIEQEEFWIGQVFDTIWTIKNELRDPEQLIKCIDVGSGCGVPGLLIAIALPFSQITLLDSTRRKTLALEAIATTIGLTERITVKTERVEMTGQNPDSRGKYQLATARAVARVEVLAEYLVPLLNPNGEALLFQGQWNNSEEKVLKQALRKLNAEIWTIKSQQLPANKGIRHAVRIRTNGKCPIIYPRGIGIPNKKPLGH